METINIYSKQLQELLGATHLIESDIFWNDESGQVFYSDGDKETCVNALLDEMETTDGYTLYYVIDDGMFYVVEDLF